MSEQTSPQAKQLLVVYNNHNESCGEPPSWVIKSGRDQYYGYFENEHGEQWLFVYSYDTETGTVRGGDAGWDEVYPVLDGRAPGLVLSREEALWLHACWKAATVFSDYSDGKRSTQE